MSLTGEDWLAFGVSGLHARAYAIGKYEKFKLKYTRFRRGHPSVVCGNVTNVT